jgi:hypothetical protein
VVIGQAAVNPLRCAVRASCKPRVTIALRILCCAQARGGPPCLPAVRMRTALGHTLAGMRLAPGRCGKNFLRYCDPAARRKPVVCHCPAHSCCAQARCGHPCPPVRRNASHPWQTPLVACDEPVFFTPRQTRGCSGSRSTRVALTSRAAQDLQLPSGLPLGALPVAREAADCGRPPDDSRPMVGTATAATFALPPDSAGITTAIVKKSICANRFAWG